MQIWTTLIHVLQLLAALTMIGLVLIQHGKGADMGASFGSGSSGSLFGASGSANFMSRSTAAAASVFFICTLALAFMSNSVSGRSTGTSSVLDRAAPSASAPAADAIPGAAIPNAIPTTAPNTIPTTSAPAASTGASSAAVIPKQ